MYGYPARRRRGTPETDKTPHKGGVFVSSKMSRPRHPILSRDMSRIVSAIICNRPMSKCAVQSSVLSF